MNYNELIATSRRIRLYLVDKGTGAPCTGLSPATVEVSLSGNPLTAATGLVVEIGSGVYYYQADPDETLTHAYLLVKVSDPAIRTFVWFEDIGARIAQNEAFPERRRLPIYLMDSSGAPVVGADLGAGGVLELSVNGDSFASATGTWGESGGGAYWYELAPSEVENTGSVVLKVIVSGADPYVFTHDVLGPATEYAGGSSGYFGYYFGTGGADIVVPPTPPTPIPAPTSNPIIALAQHEQEALARLPEYAKAKLSDQ